MTTSRRKAWKGFNQQIEGRFSGIGLSVVSVKQRAARGHGVSTARPPKRSGIEAGDTIVSVERRIDRRAEPTEATDKIKGPEGSQVTVGVLDAEDPTRDDHKKTLTRAEVELPNVSRHACSRVGGKDDWVREALLPSARNRRGNQLAHEVEKVKKEGAEGLVLDLRDNPRRPARGGGAVARSPVPARRRSRGDDQIEDQGQLDQEERAVARSVDMPLRTC